MFSSGRYLYSILLKHEENIAQAFILAELVSQF